MNLLYSKQAKSQVTFSTLSKLILCTVCLCLNEPCVKKLLHTYTAHDKFLFFLHIGNKSNLNLRHYFFNNIHYLLCTCLLSRQQSPGWGPVIELATCRLHACN